MARMGNSMQPLVASLGGFRFGTRNRRSVKDGGSMTKNGNRRPLLKTNVHEIRLPFVPLFFLLILIVGLLILINLKSSMGFIQTSPAIAWLGHKTMYIEPGSDDEDNGHVTDNISSENSSSAIRMMTPKFEFERPGECPDVLWDSSQKYRKVLVQRKTRRNDQRIPGTDHKAQERKGGEDSEKVEFPADFAVAMIATGDATKHANVERAVQSMRRRGLYEGRVIVITDHSTRYSYLMKADPLVAVVVVDQSHLHYHLKNTMPHKRLKTQVLDLMDHNPELDAIKHVAYLDVDIVVGADLNEFVEYATMKIRLATEQFALGITGGHLSDRTMGNNTSVSPTSSFSAGSQPESFMFMFLEQGGGKERSKHKKKAVWHGAVMLLHRSHSRGCLESWRTMFDSNEYERDQSALYDMYHNKRTDLLPTRQCNIIPMNHTKFLLMPSEQTMSEGRSSVFVHNTNTGRAKTIHKRVQFDYYRCAMMLDEIVIKRDIIQTKRKPRLRKKEAKEGLSWNGLELVQNADQHSGKM